MAATPEFAHLGVIQQWPRLLALVSSCVQIISTCQTYLYAVLHGRKTVPEFSLPVLDVTVRHSIAQLDWVVFAALSDWSRVNPLVWFSMHHLRFYWNSFNITISLLIFTSIQVLLYSGNDGVVTSSFLCCFLNHSEDLHEPSAWVDKREEKREKKGLDYNSSHYRSRTSRVCILYVPIHRSQLSSLILLLSRIISSDWLTFIRHSSGAFLSTIF